MDVRGFWTIEVGDIFFLRFFSGGSPWFHATSAGSAGEYESGFLVAPRKPPSGLGTRTRLKPRPGSSSLGWFPSGLKTLQ